MSWAPMLPFRVLCCHSCPQPLLPLLPLLPQLPLLLLPLLLLPCRQIIEQGTAAEVRGFLEGLERELSPVLSGFPLTEPLFQLMCHPVSVGG